MAQPARKKVAIQVYHDNVMIGMAKMRYKEVPPALEVSVILPLFFCYSPSILPLFGLCSTFILPLFSVFTSLHFTFLYSTLLYFTWHSFILSII